MSWSGLLLAVTLASFGTTACAATACPILHDHHRLTAVDVYDGPPSELASLTPDENGTWKLGYKPASTSGRFYLGCQYGSTGDSVALQIPSNVSRCQIGTYPKVVCR